MEANNQLQLQYHVVELTRKNEEYSQLIQRLMSTIEAERSVYEGRIRDLARESDSHIQKLALKCRNQKLKLIAKSAEVEQEIKRVLNSKTCKNDKSAKVIEDLERQLAQLNYKLNCKLNLLKEVEEDREKLRKMNQQLDRTMRDQKQRTINYKGLLEQEIMELRAKLKNAEEKNVELINDNVARSPILSYDKIDDDEIPSRGYMERISRADTPTTSKLNRSRSQPRSVSTCGDPFTVTPQGSTSCARNIVYLLASVVLFTLSYFMKSLGTEPACNYVKKPFSDRPH